MEEIDVFKINGDQLLSYIFLNIIQMPWMLFNQRQRKERGKIVINININKLLVVMVVQKDFHIA